MGLFHALRGRIGGRRGPVTVSHPLVTPVEPLESRVLMSTTLVRAAADAYVRDGIHAATNFGTAATLDAKNTGVDRVRETFLRFDTSAVPSIATATLRLYGKLNMVASDTVALYP